MIIIALLFGVAIYFLCNLLKSSLEDSKYPHRRCPFCGTDVSGRKGYVTVNDYSFVSYTCPNCGAYNNKSTNIWYRKKGNNGSDVEMRTETN